MLELWEMGHLRIAKYWRFISFLYGQEELTATGVECRDVLWKSDSVMSVCGRFF